MVYKRARESGSHLGMDQHLWIPFLMGWTSIYQLFWCELQGYYWFWHTATCLANSFGSQVMVRSADVLIVWDVQSALVWTRRRPFGAAGAGNFSTLPDVTNHVTENVEHGSAYWGCCSRELNGYITIVTGVICIYVYVNITTVFLGYIKKIRLRPQIGWTNRIGPLELVPRARLKRCTFLSSTCNGSHFVSNRELNWQLRWKREMGTATMGTAISFNINWIGTCWNGGKGFALD